MADIIDLKEFTKGRMEHLQSNLDSALKDTATILNERLVVIRKMLENLNTEMGEEKMKIIKSYLTPDAIKIFNAILENSDL